VSGSALQYHQLDISQPDSVDAFAAWLKQQHGKVDILVNNAGGAPAAVVNVCARVLASPPAAWRRQPGPCQHLCMRAAAAAPSAQACQKALTPLQPATTTTRHCLQGQRVWR
jgi:hypothetical protein